MFLSLSKSILDTPLCHFLFECFGTEKNWCKVRLFSRNIISLGCLGLLIVTNQRKFTRRYKLISGDTIIGPFVFGFGNKIRGFAFECGLAVWIGQIESSGSVGGVRHNVIKFQPIFFEDTANTTSLEPKESGKDGVNCKTQHAVVGRRSTVFRYFLE